MKKSKNILNFIISTVSIIIILGLLFSKINIGIKLGFFLFMAIRMWSFVEEVGKELHGRIRFIENKLGLLDKYDDLSLQEKNSRKPSYKLDVTIVPDGFAISQKLSYSDNSKMTNIFEEVKQIKGFDINNEKSLLSKKFHFVYFYNSVSNLEQIGSDYHNSFIDKIEVRGKIIESNNDFGGTHKLRKEKYSKNNISDDLVITPDFIGFHTILPEGEVMEEDKFAKMPFDEIINFLLDLYKNDVGYNVLMNYIEKFPVKLNLKLQENNTTYNKESQVPIDGMEQISESELISSEGLSDNDTKIRKVELREHYFDNPYYRIAIKIKVF